MSSIVVTGAAGFIGRHVVRLLLERGQHVIGVDRRPWSPDPGEEPLLGDLAAPTTAVAAALREADGMIHLAGLPGVRDETVDIEARRFRDNVLATEVVLSHTPLSVPLIVASSSSVYGGTPHGRPSREDDTLLPRGGYARSKLVVEHRCEERRQRGGHVGVARPFTVAGPGQRPDMALARWIRAARAGQPLRILGGADRRRDITDVADVAEGLVRMLERDVTTTVNLGTGVSHSLADLVEVVAAVVGVEVTADLSPSHPAEVDRTCADVGRCRELLNLEPHTDLRGLVLRQASATRDLVEAA